MRRLGKKHKVVSTKIENIISDLVKKKTLTEKQKERALQPTYEQKQPTPNGRSLICQTYKTVSSSRELISDHLN
jgi:hypothetical protein